MSDSVLLDKLDENLDLFHKMYDAVRIVDPIKKKVIEFRGLERIEKPGACFEKWQTGRICDNCISVRANMHNKCYMKLEVCGSDIMMITAMPIENAEKPVVLELIKNASDGMMIENGACSQGNPFLNIITEINNRIVKDELSNLYNKRYITERLPADIVRTVLENSPLSIVFLDLDNFKKINDIYGHIMGDTMLSKVSGVISNHMDNDLNWAARYGGDEFILCLNNTGTEEAYAVAEEIRKEIASISIEHKNGIVSTTVSIGIYTNQGELITPEEAIIMADHNMYEAKHNGKNKSVSSGKATP